MTGDAVDSVGLRGRGLGASQALMLKRAGPFGAGGKWRGVAGVKPGVGAGAAQDSSQVSGWTHLAEAPALTVQDAELGRTLLEADMDR